MLVLAVRHWAEGTFVLMNTLLAMGGANANAERSEWFKWIAKHEGAGTLQDIR